MWPLAIIFAIMGISHFPNFFPWMNQCFLNKAIEWIHCRHKHDVPPQSWWSARLDCLYLIKKDRTILSWSYWKLECNTTNTTVHEHSFGLGENEPQIICNLLLWLLLGSSSQNRLFRPGQAKTHYSQLSWKQGNITY